MVGGKERRGMTGQDEKNLSDHLEAAVDVIDGIGFVRNVS